MILLQLFWTFFKIGLFTFGGGYAMLPLIQKEVIGSGWLSNEELINFVAVSESTPGPFAVNISTYVGMEMAGIPGAFCATLGVALPSFIIILTIAGCYEKFKNNNYVMGAMTGLRPAVVGLILSAAISVGKTVFLPDGLRAANVYSEEFIISIAIFVLMMFFIIKKKHPIMIIGLSAVFGIVAGYAFGF